MDQVSTLAHAVTAKQAMVVDQWRVEHAECWPGPQVSFENDLLVRHCKCTCGDELTVTITMVVHVDGRKPANFKHA